jgi:uncharacterized membrane protein YbhN (UPF0104 family)
MLLMGPIVHHEWFVKRVIRPGALRLGLSAQRVTVRPTGLLVSCAFHWCLLAAAYWLMLRAVGLDLRPPVALTQPLANVVGMLVPFAPAGLGIREAAGAGYIATQLPDPGSALLYASLARAWSFCVEVAVFCTGMIVRRGIQAP